jgi:RecA/RadA recombinase
MAGISALLKKIKEVNKLSDSNMLEDSAIFEVVDPIHTPVPLINVALSGRVDGGLFPGTLMIAAESKRFKSVFGLMLASSFLKQKQDGVLVFYDTERGTPKDYWQSVGIDPARVYYKQPADIESLNADLLRLVTAVDEEHYGNLFFLIDSIGNLPSMHEVKIALEGEGKVDMARSKVLKSLFRTTTLPIVHKRCYCVVINHVYSQQSMYAPLKVSGGGGPMYNSNDVWVIGKRVDSEGKGKDKVVLGNEFVINIEKSRIVRERSQFPVNVSYEHGIQRWTGLFDIAMYGEFINVAKQGWYNSVLNEEKKFRRADIENDDAFWRELTARQDFKDFLTHLFTLGNKPLISYENTLDAN